MSAHLIPVVSLVFSVMVAVGGFLVSSSIVEYRVASLEEVVNIRGIAEYERWKTGIDYRLQALEAPPACK